MRKQLKCAGNPGVEERIKPLMRENHRKSQMTCEELMASHAAVIRTPARSDPCWAPVIQSYEQGRRGSREF
jgi:hypothetical protein